MSPLSKTHYIKYLEQREGGKIIESPSGFVTYKLTPSEVFLIDIFVEPESRESGHARKLIDQLIKATKTAGKSFITAKVYLADMNHKMTLISAFKIGFEILQLHPEWIGLGLKTQQEEKWEKQ